MFKKEDWAYLKKQSSVQNIQGKLVQFVHCVIRDKDIQLKPEEVVRQLYALRLINQYGYHKKRLAFEYRVNFGREQKKADIVIFDKDRPDTPYIIVELKKTSLKEGKLQLKSYCNATGAPIGVWTNGQQISYYHRKDPNYFENITDIPKACQSIKDILSERWTLKDLIIKDKITNEKKALKDIILEMENEVLANAGVDVFEEVFKLIFTKLYDEFLSKKDKTIVDYHIDQTWKEKGNGDYDKLKQSLAELNDKTFRAMEFRNTGQTDSELKKKIQNLFDQAKNKWKGVFPEDSKFVLSDSHLSICVSSLQDVKLFNSNLLVIDEAFEYLVLKTSKGEKGQYFTPRHVIDMCVLMLNPQREEYMIDTASGSSGFPVHTVFPLCLRKKDYPNAGGSIILHWKPNQIQQTLIPILQEEAQNQIQSKVIRFFESQKKSKQLLKCSVSLVQKAIETNEQTALNQTGRKPKASSTGGQGACPAF